MIDTHAHINLKEYRENFDDLLAQIRLSGVEKVIIPSSKPDEFEEIARLCEKYDMLHGAFGVHPEELAFAVDDFEEKIKAGLKLKKIVAIGEIGLDYHYCADSKAEQKILFEKQLQIAQEMQVPVLIHDREAHEDCFEILNKFDLKTVVMHCFSGNAKFAEKCIEKGYYLAVGGVVTFKNANDLKETVKITPLDRLLLETDSPYLTPAPFRGKINSPAYLKYIAQAVAELKGTGVSEIEKATTQNAERIFGF